jgi:hypothetical protein
LATRKKGLPILERIFPVGKNDTMSQFKEIKINLKIKKTLDPFML